MRVIPFHHRHRHHRHHHHHDNHHYHHPGPHRGCCYRFSDRYHMCGYSCRNHDTKVVDGDDDDYYVTDGIDSHYDGHGRRDDHND